MNLTQKLVLYLCILLLCGCAPSLQYNHQAAAQLNMQLGLGYLQEGQLVRAKEKLLLAGQQAPHDAEVNVALGYYFLQIHDFKMASKYYQSALALEPDDPRVQNNYAVFLCRIGHKQAARSYFKLAASNGKYINAKAAAQNAKLCV